MPVSDASLPLQKAIVARLKADPAVAALVNGRIYDGVPTSAVKPYVAFGPFQILPALGDCLDGAETTIQLDGYATGPATVQAKQVEAAVLAALDEAEFALDSPQTLVDLRMNTARCVREPDGITVHAIMIFTAHTEPRE